MSSARRDQIESLSVLGEPNRRRLYDFVAAQGRPVSRDAAAEAIGLGRPLVAFHLDRLVESGLLEATYRRPAGRPGRGGGRPTKLYRRAARSFEASLPPRRYEVAADVLAAGLEIAAPDGPPEPVLEAAREEGKRLAVGELEAADGPIGDGPVDGRACLLGVLESAGFEPEATGDEGRVLLRNCPFDALVATHRRVICAMNLALLEGVASAVPDAGLAAAPSDEPGHCCVEFRPTD